MQQQRNRYLKILVLIGSLLIIGLTLSMIGEFYFNRYIVIDLDFYHNKTNPSISFSNYKPSIWKNQHYTRINSHPSLTLWKDNTELIVINSDFTILDPAYYYIYPKYTTYQINLFFESTINYLTEKCICTPVECYWSQPTNSSLISPNYKCQPSLAITFLFAIFSCLSLLYSVLICLILVSYKYLTKKPQSTELTTPLLIV